VKQQQYGQHHPQKQLALIVKWWIKSVSVRHDISPLIGGVTPLRTVV
jgi:hypothetical protein